MLVSVEGAAAYYDDWKRVWTLELDVRGPFRTRLIASTDEWKELLSQTGGVIRKRPYCEVDAKYAAKRIEELIERGRKIVIESDRFDNVKVQGQKEKKTREERREMAEIAKRKVTLNVTVSKNDRTYGQCIWDLERLADALKEGIIPRDREGMEEILGVKVLERKRVKKIERLVQEDGTERLAEREVDVPVWDTRDLKVGSNTDDLPKPSPNNGIVFNEEVKAVFSKAKRGKPFEVQKVKDSEIVLIVAQGVDVKAARTWLGHVCEMLPWVDEPKGADADEKVFGG